MIILIIRGFWRPLQHDLKVVDTQCYCFFCDGRHVAILCDLDMNSTDSILQDDVCCRTSQQSVVMHLVMHCFLSCTSITGHLALMLKSLLYVSVTLRFNLFEVRHFFW